MLIFDNWQLFYKIGKVIVIKWFFKLLKIKTVKVKMVEVGFDYFACVDNPSADTDKT